MLENYEESISLTLRTRSSRKPLRMLTRHWKHQWLPLCLARHARKTSMGRPGSKTNYFKSKFACILEWIQKNAYGRTTTKHHEDHIAGKGTISLQHYNLVHKFIPYASSHEDTRSKSSSGQRMGETGKDSGVEPDKSQKQRKKWSMKQGRRALQFTLHH